MDFDFSFITSQGIFFVILFSPSVLNLITARLRKRLAMKCKKGNSNPELTFKGALSRILTDFCTAKIYTLCRRKPKNNIK